MNNTIESEKNAAATETPQEKMKRTKKAKPPKRAAKAKKPASKPPAQRSNTKADVIALMKRAKGATLVEIMADASYCTHLAGCERFSIGPASFR